MSTGSEESLAVSSYSLNLLPGTDSDQVETHGLIDKVLAKFPAFRSNRNFQLELLCGFRHQIEPATMSLVSAVSEQR